MRNLIILLFAFCFLSSCVNDTHEIREIVVNGNIENSIGDSVVFERNGDVLKFPIDEQGNFRAAFKEQPGYYRFGYKREYTDCYLTPGDSLMMTANIRQFDETLKYEGANAAVNNYLAAKMMLKSEQGRKMNIRQLYKMPQDSFVDHFKTAKSELVSLLKSVDLPSNFSQKEEANINYEMLANIMNYESYHKYFAGIDSVVLTEALTSLYDTIDFSRNDDFESIPEYRNIVVDHFTNCDLPECLEKLSEVDSWAIRNTVISRLNDWMSPGAKDLTNCVDKMLALASDEELKANVQKNYDSMKMLIKGNSSPAFNFKNVNDQMVALEDLKGKNVYIDVWATWCGPCKMEIPHLKELESDYHDKNIEFVSISVDVPKDEQKWKDMVADKELKGVQLISDNGWNTGFVEQYLIKGIPRFILLDDKGQIISADAPRPSSKGEIRGMIDELLTEV